MALQIEVTGPVITSAGEQYYNKLVNAEFHLKCWKEGDPKTATPVIDRKFPHQQKTVVEGKTTDELAARVEKAAAEQIQAVIDTYKYAKGIETKLRVTQMAANIQGVLKG